MPAVTLTSDLITAYKNKQRVRTMNAAGSMICTTTVDRNTFLKQEADSVLYVALIPTSAVIHAINIACSADITEATGLLNIGFYGIHKHSGDFVEIKTNALTATGLGGLTAGHYMNIMPISGIGLTVYEMLCTTVQGVKKPSPEFEPFADCENLVLALTINTPESTSNPVTCAIQVVYTPGAPSTTSLTKLTLDKE